MTSFEKPNLRNVTTERVEYDKPDSRHVDEKLLRCENLSVEM